MRCWTVQVDQDCRWMENMSGEYLVHYRDCKGGSDIRMTRAETNVFVEHYLTQNGWCFVNHQFVPNANEFRSMELHPTDTILLFPALTYYTEIADATGYSEAWLTQAEIAELVNQSQGTWVFVNDQLVDRSEVATMNIEPGSRVRLLPALIGGPKRYRTRVFDGVSLKEEDLTAEELMKDGYRLLINGKLCEDLPAEIVEDHPADITGIELRSDLVDVITGPASTMVMRRSEFEQITRQFEGPLLAVMGSTVMRNGDMTTLCDGPDELFENLWANPEGPLVLVAINC
jgi:sulfur carrier protein ThiS